MLSTAPTDEGEDDTSLDTADETAEDTVLDTAEDTALDTSLETLDVSNTSFVAYVGLLTVAVAPDALIATVRPIADEITIAPAAINIFFFIKFPSF
jgi:hypothetical protein